jgi:hypothetical protein
MTVKMDDCHRPIRLVNAAQQGQSNSVVTSKCDDPRQHPARLRDTLLVCSGERLAHEEGVVTVFNLLDCPGIVVTDFRFISQSIRCLLISEASTYDVTGISPQSRILKSSWKGFACRGTLYPPLNPNLREPFFDHPNTE